MQWAAIFRRIRYVRHIRNVGYIGKVVLVIILSLNFCCIGDIKFKIKIMVVTESVSH